MLKSGTPFLVTKNNVKIFAPHWKIESFNTYLDILTYLFIYLLTYLLQYLLTHILTYSLTYLVTYLLTYSLTYSLTYLLIYLLTHLLTYLLTHLLTYLLQYLLTHSLTHSHTHLLTNLLTYLFAYVLTLLTYLLACAVLVCAFQAVAITDSRAKNQQWLLLVTWQSSTAITLLFPSTVTAVFWQVIRNTVSKVLVRLLYKLYLTVVSQQLWFSLWYSSVIISLPVNIISPGCSKAG